MFRIDTDDAAADAPAKPPAGTPGFFRAKNPALGIVGTRLPAWWLNMVQSELLEVLNRAGIAPSKTNDGQLADAIQALALGVGGGRVCYLADEKASGTHGGTFTAGGWVDRVVTELADPWGLCSVSGGVNITLAAGTWEFEVKAPAYRCGAHQARIWDVTGNTAGWQGSSEISPISDDAATSSSVQGVLYLAEARVIKIQHRCAVTRDTDGLGKATGFGLEVYTQAVFRRLMAA